MKRTKSLIECTHVQDFGHEDDLRLPPFLGDNDWNACMAALKQTGYKGNLTYEMVYGAIPGDLGDAFVAYLKSTVEVLKSLM